MSKNILENFIRIDEIGFLSVTDRRELASITDRLAVLEVLSSDVDSFVRCDVAENPNASVHILERFAGDEDSWVRECCWEQEYSC